MACEEYIPLLIRAADGTLDRAQRVRLDTHLATCPMCLEALDAQKVAHMSLSGVFDLEAPVGFATRVLAHLESDAHWLDRFDFRRWAWRAGPVAAGLSVAAYLIVATTQTTAAEGSTMAPDAPVVATAEPTVVDSADLVALEWEAVVADDVDADVGGERAQ